MKGVKIISEVNDGNASTRVCTVRLGIGDKGIVGVEATPIYHSLLYCQKGTQKNTTRREEITLYPSTYSTQVTLGQGR